MKQFLFFVALVLFGSVFSQNLKPTDKLALLQGVVTNFKMKPLSKETIIFYSEKTKISYKVNTDAVGKFAILIPVGAVYALRYKNFTNDVDYTKMEVPNDKEATYEVGIKIVSWFIV